MRYGEQACNHFIAFKLLALLRDRVFRALRRLAPAKLDGRDKGDLITVITSDIELLEVFYAHTISPALIALLFSGGMAAFIGSFHPLLGVWALAAYVVVGVAVPVLTSHASGRDGLRVRGAAGNWPPLCWTACGACGNPTVWRRCRPAAGHAGTHRGPDPGRGMSQRTAGRNTATTQALLWFFDLGVLFLAVWLYLDGRVAFDGVLLPTLALMSSFGPVVALANLGATLQSTFAAGNRVLDLLEEAPVVEEVQGESPTEFSGAGAERVTFGYGPATILRDVTVPVPAGQTIGIVGRSGSGKSTLLKLFLRFWQADLGRVQISGRSVEQINTGDLRRMQALVTQETHLFRDTIRNNLLLAKPDATQAELEAACRKASIHDFIAALPQGYDTPVGELGDTLSGGERSGWGWRGPFCTMRPSCCWMSPPVTWTA